jgi:hypothetical protein
MLKNASEVTLVLKIIFFLKIPNVVQSFAECKVSPADGMLTQLSRSDAISPISFLKSFMKSRFASRHFRIRSMMAGICGNQVKQT